MRLQATCSSYPSNFAMLLPMIARCILGTSHSEPDTAAAEIIQQVNTLPADVGNVIQSRGYQLMAQAVHYYSAQFSPTHVMILNETMAFLDLYYNETADIKQHRLNKQ